MPIHHLLHGLTKQAPRIVAGLMSGTSLDGIDVVIARCEGTGTDLKIEQLAFFSLPYSTTLRDLLMRNSDPRSSSVRDVSQLNVRLAHAYAEAVRKAALAAGIGVRDIDLIGSHGQTIHHVPVAEECAGVDITSTFQIGDISVLSNILKVPVVGDFRLADMALGGQGAPLVPYFDYVYFFDREESRGLLNIGGIANITVLPKDIDSVENIFAFDTGPGNMTIDELAFRFFNVKFDDRGQFAERGNVSTPTVEALKNDPYFLLSPPKSTGREYFGSTFVDKLIAGVRAVNPAATPFDMVATATSLTAHTIYRSYLQFIKPRHQLDVIIVSGGGTHNPVLMDFLSSLFAPIPVYTAGRYGLDADAKEALCFAILAHETINGVPTNVPSVTGATKPTLLGKICFPS